MSQRSRRARLNKGQRGSRSVRTEWSGGHGEGNVRLANCLITIRSHHLSSCSLHYCSSCSAPLFCTVWKDPFARIISRGNPGPKCSSNSKNIQNCAPTCCLHLMILSTRSKSMAFCWCLTWKISFALFNQSFRVLCSALLRVMSLSTGSPKN